jgi:hypothetical protein
MIIVEPKAVRDFLPIILSNICFRLQLLGTPSTNIILHYPIYNPCNHRIYHIGHNNLYQRAYISILVAQRHIRRS